MRIAAAALLCAALLGCSRKPRDLGQPVRVVQDFEGSASIKPWPKDAVARTSTAWSADGRQSMELGPGAMGAFSDLAASDWRGYAVLRFTVHNAGAETAVVGVEIQDDHGDFADRHQQSFGAPPGDRVLELDFSGGLWRGEENRPYRGSVKTPIDTSKITRLAFANRGRGTIHVDRVEIARVAPIATPGGFAFDFGPTGSQVMGQTIGVFETTRYTKERGYGMIGGAPARLRRAMSYPTPLLGDGLGFDAGGFQVDLPGGDYLGWIAFERGGFSEDEQSSYLRAALLVNGAVVHEHAFDRGPHFFFEDTEVTDLSQIEQRILWPAHAVARFKFHAANGANVFTVALDRPNALPLRVAGMFLAPDTAEGRAFVDAHEKRQSEAAARAFAPWDRGRRGAGRAAPARDLVVEPIAAGAEVYPRDWPVHPDGAELGEIAAVAGQRATVTFAVYTKREGSLSVFAGSFVGPDGEMLRETRALHGSYLPMRPYGGGAAWLEVDHYAPRSESPIGPDLARAIVMEVDVPRTAKPGVYVGSIHFTVPPNAHGVPIRIRVYTVDLPELPIPVGLLMNALPVPPEALSDDRWWAFQEALLVEQGRAGLTCVTGGSGLAYTVKQSGGEYTFEGERAIRYLALARKHGVAKAVVPYGGFLPSLLARRWDAAAFARGFSAFAREHALPPHVLYAYDEPGTESELREALDVTAPFKAAGLATLGFTSAKRGDALFDRLLAATTDPALNIHDATDLSRLRAAGARPWVYNNGLDRWSMGLELWRAIKLGAAGRLEWIGLITQGFAFDHLDGREPSPAAWVIHDSLGPLPTPRWLAAREGLMDARVRLALEKAVPEGDPSLAAWSVGGYRLDKGQWTDAALSASRAGMLERIERAAPPKSGPR